jgi:endonuclease/exonuclease/phosphatase family metal-dependent hydrolase
MDEQLEADAIKAQKEVDAVKHFFGIIKSSTIKSPWHIIRLVLFFTPLASMCLPMYWAGHKNVSLITFIMSIINHGFDFGAMRADEAYLYAVLAMVMIIVLSLVEIINSLFSSTKQGYRRDIIFSFINTAVFGVLSMLVWKNGGYVKAGFYVTLAIYTLEFVLHFVIAKPKTRKRVFALAMSILLCIAPFQGGARAYFEMKSQSTDLASLTMTKNYNYDVDVVSFNVASAFGTSLEDTDSMVRCQRFADYIKYISPTFVGTQEMNSYWYEALQENLEGYNAYGVKRGGDSEEANSEMNAIFWSNEYTALETNTFWLSETPNEQSKYTYVDENNETQEAGCNRICSYAVLTDSYGVIYIFMNTHLDNSSEQARLFGINVILDRMNELKEQYGEASRIILTGDFNEDSNGEAYKAVANVLNDCTYSQAEKATYQEWGYRQTGDKPIDFIFTSGKPCEYIVLDNIDNGYVSDHYGIFSKILY